MRSRLSLFLVVMILAATPGTHPQDIKPPRSKLSPATPERRPAGVYWLFAPVADVNSNPDNPIINIRSFGEDPKKVGAFVAAFVRGVEENGATSKAQHF